MKKDDIVAKVKAKLEEISPFSDPSSLQVLGEGESDVVKPILSYIEESIDEAVRDCLNNLPTSLLSADIEEDQNCLSIDRDGIGHIGFEDYQRMVRVHCHVWDRDVTSFITSSDPLYLLQQNKYTRGKCAKPVVAYVPEKQELELYSLPPLMRPKDCCDKAGVHSKLFYIDCNKKIEKVHSKIEDYVVLRCAAIVMEILGEGEKAGVMTTEYNNKLNDILK